ncbi:MAG: hypothetical protein AAFX89_05165, partial [Pseudomonadota bacterium]
MDRRLLIAIALIGLAACTPRVVPTERGIGFDEYSNFELDRARREAQLSAPRGTIVPPPQVNTIPSEQTQAIPSSALAEAGIGTQTAATTAPVADPLR